MKRQGWGYAIDYDRELAADQLVIDQCDRVIAAGLRPFEGMQLANPWDLAWDPEMATRMGLTSEDRAALSAYCDWTKPHPSEAELPDPHGDWYSRGERICRWLEDAYSTYVDGKEPERRKHAIASRSRHRRNQSKWGKR